MFVGHLMLTLHFAVAIERKGQSGVARKFHAQQHVAKHLGDDSRAVGQMPSRFVFLVEKFVAHLSDEESVTSGHVGVGVSRKEELPRFVCVGLETEQPSHKENLQFFAVAARQQLKVHGEGQFEHLAVLSAPTHMVGVEVGAFFAESNNVGRVDLKG